MHPRHPAIELITDSEDEQTPELATEPVAQAPAPEVSPPSAALYVDGRLFPLDLSGVVLGRSVSCDVRLDLPSVSRRHAWIRPAAGGWAVHDLDSTNGVGLNGLALDSPQWLRHGDVLQIGRAQVTFVASGAGANAAAA